MDNFKDVLDRIVKGRGVTAEEITDLALFVGEGPATEAQRAAVVTALGVWYYRRFPKT